MLRTIETRPNFKVSLYLPLPRFALLGPGAGTRGRRNPAHEANAGRATASSGATQAASAANLGALIRKFAEIVQSDHVGTIVGSFAPTSHISVQQTSAFTGGV